MAVRAVRSSTGTYWTGRPRWAASNSQHSAVVSACGPVQYVPVDDQTARSAMLGAGVPRWMADALIELYQDYRRSGQNGYAAQVHDGVRVVTGRAPRTLAEALADR